MRRSLFLHLLFTTVLSLGAFLPLATAAQDLPATPVASPAATGQNCGSPGFRPIVREGVTAADLDAAGIAGEPVVAGQDTTIEAANGTPITLPAGQWATSLAGDIIIVNGDGERTVVSLVTGDSWTFPTPTTDANSPQTMLTYTTFGSWLVGPADATATDYWIINSDTGASMRTSDVLGAPFSEPRQLPWGRVSDATTAIIPFVGPGNFDTPGASADGPKLDPVAIVLSTADPADAWVPDPEFAVSDLSAAITSDGGKVALIDSSGSQVIVLDGFTGKRIAKWPVPEAAAGLAVVGIARDDTTLVLTSFGPAQVATVDIDTGEFTALINSEGAHGIIAWDTSGTAMASTGAGQDERYFWIDPVSGQVRELDHEKLKRLPDALDGWALFEMEADTGTDYALFNMITGEIAAGPINANTTTTSPAVIQDGVWILPVEPGQLIVLDGPGGRAFELPPIPAELWTGWGGPSQGISPNGECVIYALLGSGFDNPPGVTLIAPLEPGAAWTEVPFEINDWFEIPQ